MFGMGGSEILVILIVALLFLGPDKLPDAAKTISKGIRDLEKQSRVLQNTIENDEHIGGAIRDLKSALRGDEAPVRPPVRKEPPPLPAARTPETDAPALGEAVEGTPGPDAPAEAAPEELASAAPPAAGDLPAAPAVTLPPTAGEPDPDAPGSSDPGELAALVKPAAGTIAKGASDEPAAAKQKHG